MSIVQPARKGSLLGFGLVICLALPGTVSAQETADDMVGQPIDAWIAWRDATRSMQREELDQAAKLFESVSAMDLADLRLALMAAREGEVRLESWANAADAPNSVKRLFEKIKRGQRERALAEDGWHFAAIGRFKYANANFEALIESNPDPVALLELSRYNENRHVILTKLLQNTEVGPAAKQFLELLNEGERRLRMDPFEITANIAKLGGTPQNVYYATNALKASGEYAVPHMIQALQNPDSRALHAAVIKVFPQLSRSALNPLCVALSMKGDVTNIELINAAAGIGYSQALPYLAKLAEDSEQSGAVRAAAKQAMTMIGKGGGSVSALFAQLAEDYYNGADSVRADPRETTANIWYLRDNELRLIEVPAEIFADVMAMRCCEEALKADAANDGAIALWLAANFRREAKLGLDVESGEPSPLAAKDGTRPEGFPRSIYFARAAGPKYNHMVLARAVKDRDPGVALGAIAALRATAGGRSLVGTGEARQPLVQTLAFPNRQVRVKAALALGAALPTERFAGAEDVVAVLAEALTHAGRRAVLIVDADIEVANGFQTVMRAAGFDCAIGENLYAALENGQKDHLTNFDVILLAADTRQPSAVEAVGVLRKKVETSATPILVIGKETLSEAQRIASSAVGVEPLDAEVLDLGDPAMIEKNILTKIGTAGSALGLKKLDRDLSLELALNAADVLREIGQSNLKAFDFSKAVPALITSLSGSKSEVLRMKCARTLSLASSKDAQAAIARTALGDQRGPDERNAAFAALAESARHNGNLLGTDDLVQQLIEFTMTEGDLVLRAAASKALGALDLAANKASEIIRAQYRG
ncbi:MAG: hypothetical protein ABII12_07025 [Planctomycetota bacterium]